MKNVITANLLLLPLLMLFCAPVAGLLYLCGLLYALKVNKALRRVFLNYYSMITRFEKTLSNN